MEELLIRLELLVEVYSAFVYEMEENQKPGSRAGDTFFDFISSNEKAEEGTVEAQRKRR